MSRNLEGRPSFAKLARRYLATLAEYREAKGAVAVAARVGHDTRELEYHAAALQACHQEAFGNLIQLAVRMREAGAV